MVVTLRPDSAGKRCQCRGDLGGQFAGRCEHQSRRARRLTTATGESGYQRQGERESLSAAGLSAAEHVASGERVGQRGGLDRERLADPAVRPVRAPGLRAHRVRRRIGWSFLRGFLSIGLVGQRVPGSRDGDRHAECAHRGGFATAMSGGDGRRRCEKAPAPVVRSRRLVNNSRCRPAQRIRGGQYVVKPANPAASETGTRALILVPLSVCSTASTRPSACTRFTRSPRS